MTITDEKRLVLLVDDDSENIKIVHSILRDRYRVRVATTGAKALELAKADPQPDLILLDVMMPEMDGYEACGCLKADHRTRDIPVIFLTGKTEVADETRGFEAGAVDYIHKPFSSPIVSARVRNHLMLRDAHHAVAQQLLAINNELEMARQIQQSILPAGTPHIQGLEIKARFIPMSAVAGDFYDFLVVDEKHVGILIADVSGHGLASALIASMVQTAFAAQVPNAADPERILSGLNRALHGKFRNQYVTAAYLFVDMDKCTVKYAGAAHPPILWWRSRTGRATECVQNGLMLGPFEDASYSANAFSLEQGDKIVLVTDGVLESSNSSGNEFGIERLLQFVESNHALPADQFADLLFDELSHWCQLGPGQSDDITVLTIDCKGLDSE